MPLVLPARQGGRTSSHAFTRFARFPPLQPSVPSFLFVASTIATITPVTPHQFVAKWRRVSLTERSACQQHFLDLCDLLDQPKPAAADPEGAWYTFERGVRKTGGGHGWLIISQASQVLRRTSNSGRGRMRVPGKT